MYRSLSVAVVIPAYNEARLLPITLKKIPNFVDGIIVIDDGSTDDTASLVRALSDQRITLTAHRKNLGVGRAITSGYEVALSQRYDLIVVMGADDQMDPNEMPQLLEPIASGRADYAKGNRLGHPEHKQRMPRIRRLGTYYLSYMTRLATGLSDIEDSQCGFTAISREALANLPLKSLFPRYGYPNDLLSLLAVRKYRVVNVVVTPIYGSEHSGLQIHRVCLPLCGILMRAVMRRVRCMVRDLNGVTNARRLDETN